MRRQPEGLPAIFGIRENDTQHRDDVIGGARRRLVIIAQLEYRLARHRRDRAVAVLFLERIEEAAVILAGLWRERAKLRRSAIALDQVRQGADNRPIARWDAKALVDTLIGIKKARLTIRQPLAFRRRNRDTLAGPPIEPINLMPAPWCPKIQKINSGQCSRPIRHYLRL